LPVTRRGLLLFIAMCVIWGIPYLFIRVAVEQISPAVLVFCRAGIAAAILLPFAVRGGGLAGLRRLWLPLLTFSAVEMGIPWLALSTAEQQITSSLAGLLISAVPLVATVLALVLGTAERTRPAALTGLLVGIVGVGLVVGLDIRAGGWLPITEVLLVAVCYAVGPAILSRYLAGQPGVAVMAFALAACAVVYAPIAALHWPTTVPSPSVLFAVGILALVCTALAFVLFGELIAEIGPVRSTVITYVNPAVAAVLGVVALGESLTLAMIGGFALILVGSVLATRRSAIVPAEA
jgi:drug/metabolite transporter (DMT)-like permease